MVSTGLACKCFCPHCKNELVAKNGGNRKIHHFAHSNGSDCKGAIESALHKMAKDILQEYKTIMLPSESLGEMRKQSTFDKVDVEVFDKELSLRPDCVGYTDNGDIMWVEFRRTHEVDVKKAGKIISAKIDCVEIDLNSCELDPQKVRDFIENIGEKRKWIYNHKNRQIYQEDEKNKRSQHNNYGGDYEFEKCMCRHIAIDEQNTIVNLFNLDEIDTNQHAYFCIACGKEVFIEVDNIGNYSFSHLEYAPCEDDFYLHEAAKKMLYRRFNTQDTFDVCIPQRYVCEKQSQCLMFNEYDCSNKIPTHYDLKAYGYDSCEMEYKFPNEQFPYDLVLKQGCDLEKAIVIVIDADTCYIEPTNLKNRAIEVSVMNENDVFNLSNKPLCGEKFRFFNFRHSKLNTESWTKINRKILKFTLFTSGKYYLDVENCKSTNKRSAIYEMIIFNGIGNRKIMRQYAILHCYNKQRILCLCEICSYLKYVDRFLISENICIRYKTKGTPRNPLESMPVKCPYFSLDRNIVAVLEKECYGLQFIERDLITNSL